MILKVDDRVIWIDDTSLVKGKVIKIITDRNTPIYVIYWENGRTIQYTPDMLQDMRSRFSGEIKLDQEYYRDNKLKELGI